MLYSIQVRFAMNQTETIDPLEKTLGMHFAPAKMVVHASLSKTLEAVASFAPFGGQSVSVVVDHNRHAFSFDHSRQPDAGLTLFEQTFSGPVFVTEVLGSPEEGEEATLTTTEMVPVSDLYLLRDHLVFKEGLRVTPDRYQELCTPSIFNRDKWFGCFSLTSTFEKTVSLPKRENLISRRSEEMCSALFSSLSFKVLDPEFSGHSVRDRDARATSPQYKLTEMGSKFWGLSQRFGLAHCCEGGFVHDVYDPIRSYLMSKESQYHHIDSRTDSRTLGNLEYMPSRARETYTRMLSVPWYQFVSFYEACLAANISVQTL